MHRLKQTTRTLTWLRDQVDAEERRLLIQAVVVGVVVWAFVAVLKWSVHRGMAATAALLERAPHVAFIWLPLLVGAGCLAGLTRLKQTTLHYRDGNDKLHPLEAVEGDGLERAIALYFASEPTLDRALLGAHGVEARWRLPTFSLAVRKMLASFLTLASGGAGGLEASVTLVGESTAAGLFKPRSFPKIVPDAVRAAVPRALAVQPLTRWLQGRLDWWCAAQSEDLQAAQLCGIAAAIATLLGTPFAAGFFAIEVIYRRRPIVDRLIYALVSALIAFFMNHLVTGAHSPLPRVSVMPPLYVGRYYIGLAAVAVSMGVLSSCFRALRAWADHAFHAQTPPLKRHLMGAGITGAFAVATVSILRALDLPLPQGAEGSSAAWLVLRPGENIIAWALQGELGLGVAALALVGRFGATISTICSGGSGGLLFPTLTFGCLAASAWASALDVEPALLVVPAITASLASVANVPLAGQILPGVSVRRIRVPSTWADQDLLSLGIRERFGLTVIGMVDRREAADGTLDERVVLNPMPTQKLSRGDMLIVLGEDDRIARFSKASADATQTGVPAYDPHAHEAAVESSKRGGETP